ncbi:transforming growth factor beta regulator 1 isoform X3 [Narcine bancroftii]|uniref:transforming growth factor beta regulator 1 isoform X3 n=1 Tax=Narcine bancroftii TaxID=1343680 RepID=UPI0038321BC8
MEAHSLETEGEILHKSPMIHGKEQLRHGHKAAVLLPVVSVPVGRRPLAGLASAAAARLPRTQSTSSHSPETSLSPIDTMNSLSNFESEMDHDGQGSYSLFPALDNVTILPATSEALETEPTPDVSDKPNMTWLDAAQIVLEEVGRPLHIKEIKQRILDRGLVQSNSKSSLEAVLYRETQKGSRRFKRLENKNGVFALQDSKPKLKKILKKALNEKYRVKYLRLRKSVKALIFENAALCDEIAYMELKFFRTKEERRFLLKRLLQHQSISDGTELTGSAGVILAPTVHSAPAGGSQVAGVPSLPATPVASTSAGEEALGKKSKKDKRDKGKDDDAALPAEYLQHYLLFKEGDVAAGQGRVWARDTRMMERRFESGHRSKGQEFQGKDAVNL